MVAVITVDRIAVIRSAESRLARNYTIDRYTAGKRGARSAGQRCLVSGYGNVGKICVYTRIQAYMYAAV